MSEEDKKQEQIEGEEGQQPQAGQIPGLPPGF